MTTSISKQICMVYDHGLFHHVAERLAEDFKEVLYYVPWKSGFPSYEKAIVGTRMGNITRIEEFAEHLDEVKASGGMLVYPDAGDGSDQVMYRKMGFDVLGSATGDMLEYDREFLKKMLKKVGLPVLDYQMITGWENLIKHLGTLPEDQYYVKISSFRAVTETFKFTTLAKCMPHLYKMGFKLASYAPEMKFMVEVMQAGLEPGSDQFMVLGEPSESGVYGWEVKGRGYTGKVCKFTELPQVVQDVDMKLAPVYRKLGVCGMSSMESRGNGKQLFPIDYCGRCGTPSSEVNVRNMKNFSQVMRAAARGERVAPEWHAKYVAEIILHSDVLTDNHVPVSYPDKIAPYVVLRNAYRDKNGQAWCLPMDGGTMVGGACGWADSKEEAQAMALDVAEKIDVPRLDYDDTVFDKCNKNLKEAKACGLVGF